MKTRIHSALAAIALLAPALTAWADNTPQTLPFSQDWSNIGLITTNDVWTSVPGIIGYLGDDAAATSPRDPSLVLTDYSIADVIAQTTPSNSAGGVGEMDALANPCVALQGSNAADNPFLLLHLNTLGKQNIIFTCNLRDLDASTDNAVQPISIQYRVGSSGDFTVLELPGDRTLDATTGPSLATLVTAKSIALPAAANNQSLVQIRIMTGNAAGNDEWVGIDDISVTGSPLVLSFVVTTAADENDNPAGTNVSLREALANAAANPGADTITFDPALNGATIALSTFTSPSSGNTAFDLTDTGGVTVDATALSAGVKIDGGLQDFRLFQINAGASLTLHGITLTRGGGAGFSSHGGAIYNTNGTLTLTRCTLSGNSTTGSRGGAIYNATGGTLTLTHCTLSGNSAPNESGGAIYNTSSSTLTLTHCTISDNTARDGGGVTNGGSAFLTLTNTIIAGNTATAGATFGPDIYNFGTVTAVGANLVQAFSGNAATGPGTISTAAPNLAPPGSYGGPTQTMPPLPGSPAIDAAVGSAATSDQRGFPIPLDGDANGTALADIGAVEAQTLAGQNLSFETPVQSPGGYTGSVPGWTDGGAGYDINNRFIEYIVSFSALGNQHFGLEAVRSVYQDLPATYEAGALYRLRVAVGNRAGQTNPGNVSTYTLTTPGGTPAVTPGTLNASTLPAGTFADAPAQLVDTAVLPALVGQRIRVQLTAGGTARSHFDNVRVERVFLVTTVADSGPGSLRQAVLEAAVNPGADTITFAAPLVAGSVVGLTADLALTDVTLDTAIAGGSVDVAVNVGTLSFRSGSAWTGGGRILLGAISDSAAATVEVNGPDGFTLAAPITVRAGSSGVKTLRAANVGSGGTITTNTFAGVITLLAPATVERVDGPGLGEYVDFTGPMELGAHLLTVNANDDVYFSGPVGRSGGTGTAQLVKNGGGLLFLRGGADNPRLTATVTAGQLNIEKTSTTTNRNALGSGLTAADGPALTVMGAASVFVGSGGGSGGDQIADTASVTVQGQVLLYGNETLDALNGGGTVRNAPLSSITLTLGAGNGSGNFTGSLNEGGGIFSLTKTGTNTQTVAGGTMTGPVLVSGGTLNVTGSLTDIASATVASGAILAGSGSVKNLTLASGSFFAPNTTTPASDIGTLTATGTTATWNGGATARFHLSNTGNTSDKLAAPALNKGSAGSYTFDFQNTGTVGQLYTLATFTSSTFAAADFTYANLAPGLSGYFTKTGTTLTFTTLSTVVSTPNNSGPGSLRQAVLDAALTTGADTITFAPGFTGLVTLTSEVSLNNDVTIDASNIAGGVTLDGGNTTRLFTVTTGQTVVLKNLTLTRGNGSGESGGAVSNSGTLTVTRCTLSANSSTFTGGAIYNAGGATLALTHCTLFGNTAPNGGGAINNAGGDINNPAGATLTLTHCTLSGNTAPSGLGGGISTEGPTTLSNSILAGNTASTGPDVYRNGVTPTVNGVNFIGNNAASGLAASPTLLTTAQNGPINLAPLAAYGGPTQTMALMPGSPARNSATVLAPAITSDQRGFPIVGVAPDIGAYEAGTFLDFDAWSWETLPANATLAQHAATFDFDGDGRTLLLEYAGQFSGTTPEGGTPVAFTRNPAGTLATLVMPYRPSAADLLYTIERSTNLTAAWTPIATVDNATGTVQIGSGVSLPDFTATTFTLTDTFITGQPRVFYRMKATQQ